MPSRSHSMSKTSEKKCPRGHLISASWDLCPYCPPEKPGGGEISIVRPRSTLSPASPEARGTAAEVKPVPRRRTSPQNEPAPSSRTIVKPIAGIGTIQPRHVVGWLVGLTGAVRGESYPVRIGKTSIGRDTRSDVVVMDDQTSSHHASLVYRPEEKRFILMDNNSTNGTYVNDAEIESRKDLAHRDVIRIGSQSYLFVALDYAWDELGVSR